MLGGPYHILAKKGDVAERVIVAGDPARVEQVAQMLKNPRLVSSNRGLPVYTGEYGDVRFSVACHGMGGPSSAIVFEELRMLGAEVMVRLGSAGGLLEEMGYGEIVIPTVACYLQGSGAIAAYAPGLAPPTAPSYDVLESLVKEARRSGEKFRLGPVVSSDAFYAEDPDFVKKWTKLGVIAVEMECATLFALGHMRGFKTGSILVLSDNVVKMTPLLHAGQLKGYVEKAAKIALEALRKIEV